MSHLPRTILGAVVIGRHLAIKFLWVDCLCICQGDAEDWARESARMTEVYSNAHLVIAANHAKDSSAGCFHMRTPRPRCVINLPRYANNVEAMVLYLRDEAGLDLGKFENEPLTERGWALQERVLATRVLHYNNWQMYFECNAGILSEDGCSARRYLTMEYDSIYDWGKLLSSYLPRRLTKEADKLPALSGLAKLFGKELKAQYVAGLWSTDLISGLSWYLPHSTEPVSIDKECMGPSWSWASYDQITVCAGFFGGENIAKSVWNVKHKTETNPYGEISSAWLRVRAPILRLVHSKVERLVVDARLLRLGLKPYPRMRTSDTDCAEGQRLYFDNNHVVQSSESRDWHLEVIILQERSGSNKRPGSRGICFGLVGYLMIEESDEAARAIENEENWATVTLI